MAEKPKQKKPEENPNNAVDEISQLKLEIAKKQAANAERAKELRAKITKEPNTAKANEMILELTQLEANLEGVITNNQI